jgi:OmpA-OmpF porin, OOP family
MKRLILTAIFALVFITTSAQAADKGMYVSGNAGLSMASDSDLSVLGFDIGEISFDPGFNVAGALGYDYGSIRAEFEIAYRAWDMDEFTIPLAIPPCPCTGPVDGDASALSFMVNGYYDFQITNSSLAPYLGGGIGGANVNADLGLGADDSDFVFAYQFMTGIGFEINPSTTLTLGYRYFATTDPGFDIGVGTDLEATVSAHEFNVGARFMF